MKIQKPQIINLPITEVCDSQCIMCNVWTAGKTDQFTPENIKNTFTQDFFSEVRHIGISGGEPTLNEKLIDICTTILDCVPKLKSLSITSHGYHTHLHENILPIILGKSKEKNVSFSLNLSLDGIGEMHTKVRRIVDAFEKVTATSRLAKELGIPVQFQCTITPVNIYNIVHVREYAIENNMEVVFRIASYIARLSNGNLSERIKLSDKQRSFVADFLESPRTIMAARSLGRRLFYSDLSHRLKTGAPRLAPCFFQSKALFLSPDQSIYNCSRSEVKLEINNRNQIGKSINSTKNQLILDSLISDTCKSCYHDQSGRWALWKYITVHNKFYYKFKSLKKIIQIPVILKNWILPIKNKKYDFKYLNNVLVIGCYGGEHVGDAAILGGVILRLKEKYGIETITILSIRPDRTRCWVQNLAIKDITIKVHEINERLDFKDYDGLVLGGGPVMSIPVLLSNHLSIIRKFKNLSKPFIIEGIGIGPLNSWITKQMAAKILKSASLMTVRTENDYKNVKERGLNVVKTHDPAFNYLNQLELNNFTPDSTLENLINTEKEIWVINLRPLWAKYSNGNDELKIIENNVIDSIANIIIENQKNKRFIFMPMNADQFGFSDLEIAFKLEKRIKLLSNHIDFKIWEYEPDINNCIYLLKKAKLTISMRFHGCIFSLASRIPTIGIDYSTSEKGKVYSLFKDFEMENYVINIKDISSRRLSEKINKVIQDMNS